MQVGSGRVARRSVRVEVSAQRSVGWKTYQSETWNFQSLGSNFQENVVFDPCGCDFHRARIGSGWKFSTRFNFYNLALTDIILVEVRRRFIKRQNSAIDGETFGKRDSNQNRCQNLLPRWATAAHVDVFVVHAHHNAIVIVSSPFGSGRFFIGFDLYPLDVGAPIDNSPQLPTVIAFA